MNATMMASFVFLGLILAFAGGTLGFYCLRRVKGLAADLGSTRTELQKTQRAVLTLQSQLQDLHKQTQALQKQDQALRQLVKALSTQTELIGGRQQELESRDVGQMTYAHASRLASMGAEQADLISSCGLSPAEARLLELMHRRDHATQRDQAV